jgi:hypothetical protein
LKTTLAGENNCFAGAPQVGHWTPSRFVIDRTTSKT